MQRSHSIETLLFLTVLLHFFAEIHASAINWVPLLPTQYIYQINCGGESFNSSLYTYWEQDSADNPSNLTSTGLFFLFIIAVPLISTDSPDNQSFEVKISGFPHFFYTGDSISATKEEKTWLLKNLENPAGDFMDIFERFNL